MGWFRMPVLIASSVLVAATFLVAQCTEFWQFVLCQGIAVGVSVYIVSTKLVFNMSLQVACGTIFGPLMGIIPHWFQKKLGLAYGIMAVGSSVGGTVFPIIVQNLILKVGCV